MSGVAVGCRGADEAVRRGDGGVLAVDGLDLDVPAGSVFGLLGPNGAGKTTTLRLITGLATPTAGAASIDGVEVDPRDPGARRAVGVLDQDPRYYGWMTGRELVELAGRLQGLEAGRRPRRAPTPPWSRSAWPTPPSAGSAATRAGCASGSGSPRRSSPSPACSILDEPVSSLDPEGRRDLLALIADLRERATIIFSTHVLSDVERICDRVGILDHGRLVTEGPLDELLARYALPLYRLDPEPGQAEAVARAGRATPRAGPWVDRVDRDRGGLLVSVTDADEAAAGCCRIVVEAGVRLAAFERVRPSLEDVFLRLVGRAPDGTAWRSSSARSCSNRGGRCGSRSSAACSCSWA